MVVGHTFSAAQAEWRRGRLDKAQKKRRRRLISLQASPVWTSLKSPPPAASPPVFDGSVLMTRGAEGGRVATALRRGPDSKFCKTFRRRGGDEEALKMVHIKAGCNELNTSL